MKITFNSLDDFFDFVPMILGTALKNVDPDSPSADFYDNVGKKMSTQINAYTRENPELRRKLKLMISGLGSSNTVLTIKSDKKEQTREEKYLTQNYKTPSQAARLILEETDD